MSNLTFTSLQEDKFLYLMGLDIRDIEFLSPEEIASLREDLEVLRNYFNKKRLPFTPLFVSSVKGKIGAINSRLIHLPSGVEDIK